MHVIREAGLGPAGEWAAALENLAGEGWRPREEATLLFVVRKGRILLIHKKRGLGAGKINGPGGRIEPGETPLAAAVREVEEELCATPLGISERGELRFQFRDGFSLRARVFLASGLAGEPRETEEARPIWVPVARIPYDRMWADDRVWMPRMLEGCRFRGAFLFDGDRMLAHRLDVPPLSSDGSGPRAGAGPGRRDASTGIVPLR